MAKRRSGGVNGDRTAKRRRRHLYLVVDDWLWGYSIRKVDLSSDPCSDEPPHLHNTAISGEGAEREQRLPPAVFRLEAHRGHPDYFAAAFGTKIIAMDPNYVGVGGRNTHPLTPSCGAPVFDVRTRLFGLVPRPKMNLINPIYFSVDKRLYALSCNSFQLLQTPPLEEPGDLCWCELPKYPFKHKDITSYTVHPDGRTIFVSTKRRTFTFDTAEAHLKWKQHGKWMLPFTDRAYFDSELDAWVGLSADPGAAGHICACDVVSSSSDSSDGQCLSWKLSKEKIFSEDSVEKHVGATLIYMGDRSKFCLVQCVSITGDDCADERNFYRLQDEEDEDLDETDQPCRHLFRVTTFSLKFDKDGHLTTGNSRRVRYYKVPEAASDFALEDPVAFWM